MGPLGSGLLQTEARPELDDGAGARVPQTLNGSVGTAGILRGLDSRGGWGSRLCSARVSPVRRRLVAELLTPLLQPRSSLHDPQPERPAADVCAELPPSRRHARDRSVLQPRSSATRTFWGPRAPLCVLTIEAPGHCPAPGLPTAGAQ